MNATAIAKVITWPGVGARFCWRVKVSNHKAERIRRGNWGAIFDASFSHRIFLAWQGLHCLQGWARKVLVGSVWSQSRPAWHQMTPKFGFFPRSGKRKCQSPKWWSRIYECVNKFYIAQHQSRPDLDSFIWSDPNLCCHWAYVDARRKWKKKYFFASNTRRIYNRRETRKFEQIWTNHCRGNGLQFIIPPAMLFGHSAPHMPLKRDT